MDSAKNGLMPLEPKLLVMCERNGKALEIVYVLYTFPEPVVIDTIVKWVLKKVLSINANFFSGDH